MILKFDLTEKIAESDEVTFGHLLAHACENASGSVSQSKKFVSWADAAKATGEVELDEEDYKTLLFPAVDKADLRATFKARLASVLETQFGKQKPKENVEE